MDDTHSSTHRQLLHIDLNLQTKELGKKVTGVLSLSFQAP